MPNRKKRSNKRWRAEPCARFACRPQPGLASAAARQPAWPRLWRGFARKEKKKTRATIAPTHPPASREEWLKERLELLEAEKAHTRAGDELALRRQQLPWVKVAKDYAFDTDDGLASLSGLFRGRSQLLVYHFMFGPDYEAGCPSCSA